MRLALNFQTPAIEEALWRHAPGLELVRLSATGAPVGDVDALLTPLLGTQPLAFDMMWQPVIEGGGTRLP